MKTVVKFVRDYPGLTLSYSIYTFLWLMFLRGVYRMDQIPADAPKLARLTVGEGMIFAHFFLVGLTIIYLMAILLCIAFYRKNRRTYLIAAALIVIPATVITLLGYL